MYRLLALLFWLLLSTVLQAAVFKCISPSGQHSYQDHPCPADHVAHTLKRGYFSQISREPYQRDVVKLQQGRPTGPDWQLQREQRKTQQLRQHQLQQALKTCKQLRSRQLKLQGQLQRSRSALQTQRLQERLASQQQALQDAGCIP